MRKAEIDSEEYLFQTNWPLETKNPRDVHGYRGKRLLAQWTESEEFVWPR